jgi:hypothetical protein
MGRDIENVRAQERFPTGQNDDGSRESGDVVEKPEAFLRGEFTGIRAVLSGGTAMDASKVAAAGHFPGDKPQGMS